jgi:hypothetical protein
VRGQLDDLRRSEVVEALLAAAVDQVDPMDDGRVC